MISVTFPLFAFLLSSVVADTGKRSAFTPIRIRYDDLVSGSISLLDALEDSSGIVSMTDLPEDFTFIKKDVLSHLHSCMLDQQESQGEYDVAKESFPDGTIRRTLATATTKTEGPLRLAKTSLTSSIECQSFEKNLERFRSISNMATRSFAKALSREMEPHLKKPLLTKRGDDKDSYDTIEELVVHGEQLEHFHSYQKTERVGEEYSDEESKMATIDVHADQGFFIAFTPGMMMSSNSKDKNPKASSGFYIVEEGPNETLPIHVEFDIDTDDLVFMLGDGVNQ